MFFGGSKKEKRAAKWMIQVVTVCILIYLGIRHVDAVAGAVIWLANLFEPLILGIIMALVLDVPMEPIEKRLFQKKNSRKIEKNRRGAAILISLVFVFSIFLGVAFLVIPELMDAVPLVSDNILHIIEETSAQKNAVNTEKFSLPGLLAQMNFDWDAIKAALSEWLAESRSSIMEYVVGTAASISNAIMNIAIGLVCSIYILYNKEKMKKQAGRLLRAWLPGRFSQGLTHVACVCSQAFKRFIAGQTVEAIILGSLCTVGMFLLHLPYAPMVGALVGVTALIPIVGAWTGMIVGAFIILTVSPFKAAGFVVFLMILQQIEDNVIYPRVVGNSIGLPSLWVLVAITAGGSLAGPVGMFLGVPTASALYQIIKEATVWKEQRTSKENDKKSVQATES